MRPITIGTTLFVTFISSLIGPMLSISADRYAQEKNFIVIAQMVCARVHQEKFSDLKVAKNQVLDFLSVFSFNPAPTLSIIDEKNNASTGARFSDYRFNCDLSHVKQSAVLELAFSEQAWDWGKLLVTWLICMPFTGLAIWLFRRKLDKMQKEAVFAIETVISKRLGLEHDRKIDLSKRGLISRMIDSEIPLLDKLNKFIQTQKSDIQTQMLNLSEAKRRADIGEFAAQVAHDISTPIEVISRVLEKSGYNLGSDEAVFISSVQTLRESVQDISNRYRATLLPDGDWQQRSSTLKLEYVSAQVKIVIGQMKSVWPEVTFDAQLGIDHEIPVKMNSSLFQGAIRNIIKNAIEAMQGAGKISVVLEGLEQNIKILIADQGPGIPGSIKNTLFDRGVSFGKEAGSGLGLFNAREAIQGFGGAITVSSVPNKGTTFEITLPGVEVEQGTCEIFYSPKTQFIILDDDHLIHFVWNSIFKKLVVHVNVQKFFAKTDFINWYNQNRPSSNVIFFIDQEIKEKFRTQLGMDLIAEFKISHLSYLVTGLGYEHDTLAHAKEMNLRIIDKLDISRTKFTLVDDMSEITHVLIDDDITNHKMWKPRAENSAIKVKAFLNYDEFEKWQHLLNRKVEVYVDLYIGKTAVGGEIARRIRGLGFTNVKIATSIHMMELPELRREFEVVSKFHPFKETVL